MRARARAPNVCVYFETNRQSHEASEYVNTYYAMESTVRCVFFFMPLECLDEEFELEWVLVVVLTGNVVKDASGFRWGFEHVMSAVLACIFFPFMPPLLR